MISKLITQSFKVTRLFLISLLFSSIFFINSCAWFGGDAAPVFPTATITGALKTDGAMPSEVLNLMKAGSARTVVPSALGTGTVTYVCEIKTADNTVVPVTSYNFSTESDVSGNVFYTITGLPLTATPQTFKLTITLKVGTNEVLRCAEQELEGLSLTQPAFQRPVVLRPISGGTGTFSLVVHLQPPSTSDTYKVNCNIVNISNSTSVYNETGSFVFSISDSYTFSDSLSGGTYRATFSIYKNVSGSDYLVYQFDDIVNVFKSLQTNTWVKNDASQEFLDDSGSETICKITPSCLENFLATTIYVDSATTVAAENQTGSYLAPFSDIRNAFYYIRNISTSDSTTTYTIQVKGGSSFTFSSGITVDRNITVKCWSTTPGDNLGSATILADSSSFTGPVIFNIRDGKKFTAHHGLIIDGNNKSVIGVEVSDGIFEMCGGGNKIRNCNIGLALSEKTSTNTVAANLSSGMITSNKTGVSVTSSNTLNVSGVITINGNVNTSSQKNNVYLPDGITFNVNGELTNGANICVSTATAATLATNVSIATGYSYYHTTSTTPPSNYIHSDLGDPIIFNGTSDTVEIAKNGGNIKNSYDVKFSFAASSTLMKPDTAKAITITPTITTLNASGTSIQLYYNPADQKLYLEETFENLYLPDIEDSDYNKVTWNAALYNSGVLITGYQPTVATDDPANKFTLPALPAEKYTLLITANYLGIKHDAGFGVMVKDPWNPTSIPGILPSGTNGSNGTSAKYINFGDWPQTIKSGDVEIDENETKTQGAFTYYLGSDGNYYIKCKENAYETGMSYSDGTSIAEISANSYKYFKVEPIKWRVLTENYNGTGKWLLLAENIIAEESYYDNEEGTRTISGATVYCSNYMHSRIRAYLNGLSYNKEGTNNSEFNNAGFLQTAFSEESQSRIITTEVKNDLDNMDDVDFFATNADYICDNTNDKVFLLSIREAREPSYGFAPVNDVDAARNKAPTDYAKCNYATDVSGAGEWWLRSPFYDWNSIVRVVYNDSTAGYHSGVYKIANYEGLGVAPAICIDAP